MNKILGKMGNKQVPKKLGVLVLLLIAALIVLIATTRRVGNASDSADSTYLQSSGRIANQTRMGNESARVSDHLYALSGLPAKFQPQNGEVTTTNVDTKHLLYR